MANHADIRLRDAEEASGFPRSLFIVKGQHDHRTLAFLEHLDAARELRFIDARHGRWLRDQIRSELRQQLLVQTRAPAQFDDGHTARAQGEVSQLLRLAQTTRAQRFEHLQQHLLNEVVSRRCRPKVTKSIEANPRRHPATHFCFSIRIAARDTDGEMRVGHVDGQRPSFYVTPIC